MNLKNKIETILIENILEQNQYLDVPIDLSKGNDSHLYSVSGQLDSLSLITIIADIEKELFTLFKVRVQLASEQDLSVENSPFSKVGSMVDFIEKKLQMSMSSQVA